MAVDDILGILVLVEVGSRSVFSSGKAGLVLKARGWIGWTLVTVALAHSSRLERWGPWPTWTALKAEPAPQLPLLLVVLTRDEGAPLCQPDLTAFRWDCCCAFLERGSGLDGAAMRSRSPLAFPPTLSVFWQCKA